MTDQILSPENVRIVAGGATMTAALDTAIKNKLGARGLRSICEQIFDDAMYDAPSSREKTFTVTLDYAKSKLENSL